MSTRVKFSKTTDTQFSSILNQRVAAYFKSGNINPLAGRNMVWKTLLLVAVYFSVYLVVITQSVTNIPLLFMLWAGLGFLLSFIGMSVMHDTVHGAFTKNRFLRSLLRIPIIAIGVDEGIWRIEHNILHHTYTNVNGLDQDIHEHYVFRLSPRQKRKWFHNYQHIYATFVYGLMVIEWLTVKEFNRVARFYRMGYIKTYSEAAYRSFFILAKKVAFYFIFLVLPLMLLPLPPTLIVSMFLTMLVVAGIFMTVVFQLAHVVSHCEYGASEEELSEKNWHVHQLETTCNFAHRKGLLSFLIGGLNYQIEHHLFPQVCHTHYPEISKLVKQTAEEFGYPYHYEPSFKKAVLNHFAQLRRLGSVPVPQ